MSYHNRDYAACTDDNCPKRLECVRWWLGQNKDPWQTYGVFTGDNCKYFINKKDCDDKETTTSLFPSIEIGGGQ